jgi:hypothetical protein
MAKAGSAIILSILISFVFGSPSFAQQNEVSGTILDSASAPIPYVSIVVKDDSTDVLRGTISDLSGKFKLHLDHRYDNDTLKFSSVGFAPLFIPVQSVKGQQELIVRLHESTTTLQTILIEDLTPKELLTRCINAIAENYLNISFVNTAFYWKAIKEDSVYKSMQEALVTVHEHHSPQGSTRAFSYDSTTTTGDPPKAFIELDNIENLFFFDFIRTGSGITNLPNLDEWKCEYINVATGEFRNSTVIQATRKDKLGQFRIYINASDYSFARIEFSYKWPPGPHPLNHSMLYNLNSVDGIVQYQKTNKKYGIKYLYVKTAYTAYRKFRRETAFNRNTIFELTLLSSSEMKFHSDSDVLTTTRQSEWKPVIVNTAEYCKARAALGGDCEVCE